MMQRKSQESKKCPGEGEGTSEKWENGGDLRGASLVLVVSGNSEDIFVPVSDEMRSGFQLISPSKVQTFVRRGSGCVACVAARPLVCLQLRCASGRRHAVAEILDGDQVVNLGPNRKGFDWTDPVNCGLPPKTSELFHLSCSLSLTHTHKTLLCHGYNVIDTHAKIMYILHIIQIQNDPAP